MLRDDRGRGDLHQHDVVEADAVEAVLEREHALDLVRLDHRGQHVVHRERRLARGDGRCATASRRSARMPPRLSDGWPHSAASQVSLKSSQRIIAPMLNAACTGIELERRARHLRAVGHDGAGHDRARGAWCTPGRRAPRSRSRACRSGSSARSRSASLLVILKLGDVVGDVGEDLVGLGRTLLIGADMARGSIRLTCAARSERTSGPRGRCSWPTGG